MDTNAKITEAETYLSHGLYEEAKMLFQQILADSDALDQDQRKQLQDRILFIQSEIKKLDEEEQEIATEDVIKIKESWEPEGNVNEILDSALSFKELGLHKEAVEELSRLLQFDYPVDKIASELTECLFESYSPSRVFHQVEKIISNHDLSKDKKAEIKYIFGVEMEQRDHFDLALEFFESIKEIDPEFSDIENKINGILEKSAYDSKYDYLLKYKLVTGTQLKNALALSKKLNKSIEFILLDHFRIPKEEVGKSLSLFYKVPYKPFSPDIQVPYELLSKIKKTFLLQQSWIPLNWDMPTGTVDILIDDPGDLVKTDHISTLIKAANINLFVGIKEDIHSFINHCYDEKQDSIAGDEETPVDTLNLMPDIDFEEDFEEDELDEVIDESSSQIVRLVDQILISAYRKNASDIHIEPSGLTKKAAIRFRVDGVCQDFLQVPISNSRAILSRIKIMSGLDIAERRLPQDGKIKFKRKGIKTFELRVATLPTAGGLEDAVLRILAESGAMKLDDMGIREKNLNTIKKLIVQPYGIFLVVGPTGSGKTTTLHSALGFINKPGIKIWTAEDPVEISQLGLRQVECNTKIGLDFARVMRAFLRADPDVIMIGEMRDLETAAIGIEASLTGHLVFSTLHTNSAPETVTRLLDMGLNPLNFSDAFLGVLAQRLVRRLCKKCFKEYHPSKEEFNDIVALYGKNHFESAGIELTDDFTLHQADGCEDCSDTGYRGRLGIHELLEGTKEIKKMIKGEAPSEALFEQAAKDGMLTLVQDGILKTAIDRMTDLDEIKRVCVS